MAAEPPTSLEIDAATRVSMRWLAPSEARAAFVLAHGAGAGMDHPFLAQVAEGFAARGIATLRFNFAYMEERSRRPDPPERAHAAIRAAVAEASRRAPSLPLFAGGKSFGARMTSQAQAAAPLARVAGLVFLGFPLHRAGAPGITRAAHLQEVRVPMLFLQGTRDALADMPLVEKTVASVGPRATLHRLEGADHAFHVLKRSGRTDAEVLAETLDVAAAWMRDKPEGL